MQIGILGTGMVGSALGTRLCALGHDVMMGSRTPDNDKAAAWVHQTGAPASQGTFGDAARFGDMVICCTRGDATLAALEAAGAEALGDKVLVDVTNPLDFSHGMPPSLLVSGTDSLGEQVQRAFPEARVVKALNTVHSTVMVDPGLLGEDHDVFLSGNDAEAKQTVEALLRSFGWQSIVDLGDITTARGTEAYLLLWVRLWQCLGTGDFNVRLVKKRE